MDFFYSPRQLKAQDRRAGDAHAARLKLCNKLKVRWGTPDEMLQDLVSETFDVWAANELEADLRGQGQEG